MPKGPKAEKDGKNDVSDKGMSPFKRIELTVNLVKATDPELEDRKVAVIDMEGALGFWDWDKYEDGMAQNTSHDIGNILKDLEKDLPNELKINIINCPGGLIEEGIAMHDKIALFNVPVTTDIIGYAASMAVPVAQVGNHRRMSANAKLLVHKPMACWLDGVNVEDLAGVIESLDLQERRLNSMMIKRGVDSENHLELMKADGGHGKWISAEEALEFGYIDEVYEPFSAVAMASPDNVAMRDMCKALKLPDLPEDTNIDKGREPEDNIENANPEEESMATPEETVALISQTVAVTIAEINKTKEPVKEPVVEVATVPVAVKPEFKGDLNDVEAVAQFEQDSQIAELEVAVDRTDIASIRQFQKAVAEIRNGKQEVASVPGFTNAKVQTPVKGADDALAKQTTDDTIAFLTGENK